MIPDISGHWIFHGHPWDAPHRGRISITLTQEGKQLSGKLVQLIGPASGKPPADPEATAAVIEGEILEDPTGKNHLVILKRINNLESFRAVFVGALNEASQTISGTFKNTKPGGGTFVMEKEV